MKYFIYNFTFIPHGLLWTHKWQAPKLSGFIAQFVRVSHRYYEVTGLNPVEVLTFSAFYIQNCINCFHKCEDHSLLHFTSAAHYTKYFIQYFRFIPHRLLRTHKSPAPNVSGFIAQLVRASHQYRRVIGSNPVEVLTFSGFYIHNCINCFHNCEDHKYLISHPQFNMWNISYITSHSFLTGSFRPTNDKLPNLVAS